MAKDRSINALNGNLFDLIERLTNPDVTPEEVELLTKVSDSVAGLAKQITDSERMVNERVKIVSEYAPEKIADVMRNQALGYD